MKEFEKGDNSFIGVPLIPNLDKTDGIRGAMGSGSLIQALVLDEGSAECPVVFTSFEKQSAEWSRMIYRAPDDMKIIYISENPLGSKTLYCTLHNKVIKVDIPAFINFTESYGCVIKDYTGKFEKGSIIPKGFILYSSTAYDEQGNYGAGTNLYSILLSIDGTFEDACLISKTAANDKLAHNYIHQVSVIINKNDIPLNVHGRDGNYKAFAEKGEIFSDFLYAMRKINYDDLSSIKDSALNEVRSTDNKVEMNGTVIDIKVYNNLSLDDEVFTYPYMAQVKRWVDQSNEHDAKITKLYETLKTKGADVDDDINYHHGILALDVPYRAEKVFDGVMITFTVCERVPAKKGTKLTGRYGNKGVVSRILPDHLMPHVNGKPIDAIFNPLAIGNRLIPSALMEPELDFLMCRTILLVDAMNLTPVERVKELVKIFFRNVSEEQSETLLAMAEFGVSEDDWTDIKENMSIHQGPFWDNSNIDKIEMIYSELERLYPEILGEDFALDLVTNEVADLGIKEHKFYAIVGRQYIFKLKHEPMSKFSVRSSGVTDSKHMPSRIKGTGKFNQNPVRFGEQEFLNAAMYVDRDKRTIDDIIRWLRAGSSNKTQRLKRIVCQLGENPDTIDGDNNSQVSTLTILNAYIQALRLKLNKSEENDDDK